MLTSVTEPGVGTRPITDLPTNQSSIHALTQNIQQIPSIDTYGFVLGVAGNHARICGPRYCLTVGRWVKISLGDERTSGEVRGKIIGFDEQSAICMPLGDHTGIRPGAKVRFLSDINEVRPDQRWLGRVINGFAEPLDGKGALLTGNKPYSLEAPPIRPQERAPLGHVIDCGVRAINCFASIRQGQRLGIFSGSGVGKSSLLGMLAGHAQADVNVIGLIGERGREVRDFLQDNLSPMGRQKSIIVVATSDEPALARLQAAFMTMTIAEYFRDQGLHVLCLVDSVTRIAQAERQVGLTRGEPPTTRGYTPGVFALLPKLLERAGPGSLRKNTLHEEEADNTGYITGFFSVLVEGDDEHEPITDTVRGTLDGHLWLDRKIANKGRFPAIHVPRSISRSMPDATPANFRPLIAQAREMMATYDNVEELLHLGAYRAGADPKVDRAIVLHDPLENFLSQAASENISWRSSFEQLETLMQNPPPNLQSESKVS